MLCWTTLYLTCDPSCHYSNGKHTTCACMPNFTERSRSWFSNPKVLSNINKSQLPQQSPLQLGYKPDNRKRQISETMSNMTVPRFQHRPSNPSSPSILQHLYPSLNSRPSPATSSTAVDSSAYHTLINYTAMGVPMHRSLPETAWQRFWAGWASASRRFWLLPTCLFAPASRRFAAPTARSVG